VRGWAGCYIADGVLHLTHPRRIGRNGDRAVLYLDGTATRESAQALLGPSTDYKRIRVALDPGSRVVRVNWSASGKALPPAPAVNDDGDAEGAADEKQAKASKRQERLRADTLLRLKAVVARYESRGTCWVLHKGWTIDPAVRDMLADAFEGGRVTYYGAADAVGSNRFEACERIVLADWHVPRAAVTALAETMALRAAEHGMDPSGVDWSEQAAHAQEGSLIVQAAWRVRPAENARELVLLTEREPPAWWPVAELVDCDALVQAELDTLPERMGADARDAALVRQEVQARGCLVLPAPVARGQEVSPIVYYGETPRPLATALQRGGSELSTVSGLALAYAQASTGAAVPVLYDPAHPPSAALVAGELVRVRGGVAWAEWQGERVTLEDGTRPTLAALEALPALEAVTWEALADACGVSTSTVRRRLATVGIADLEALRARWQASRPHVVLEVPGGEAVALAGGRGWLWLTSSPHAPRVRVRAGADPPPIGAAA
jgi:hypothetical protein